MADTKTQRGHLNDFKDAARQIDLAGVAIKVLESMTTSEADKAIKLLQRGQHRQVKRMDEAAAKLGAPYPTGDRPYG